MAVNFKKIEKIVKSTISDLGEKATVTLEAPSSNDFSSTQPFEGPADSPTTFTVEAVVTPYKKVERDDGIDRSKAEFTVFITGSALTTTPAVGWLCVLDSVKYRVIEVVRTRPGVTTLLWKLLLER